MSLRYFATNRDMEGLGRRRKAGERSGLELGGYYFVDMQDYMAFYLGEVDAEVMPPGAVETRSKADVFDGFLANDKIGQVVVCVHGFNVELFEAFTWFRVLTDTMRHLDDCGPLLVTDPDLPEDRAKLAKSSKVPKGALTAFIGFSWPSNGRVFDYLSDQRDAQGSAPALANLLARLHMTDKKVSLLCHSMGNFVACHMLSSLVPKQLLPICFSKEWIQGTYAGNDKRIKAELARLDDRIKTIRRGTERKGERIQRDSHFVERLVMIAPDVERRHVTKAFPDLHGAESAGKPGAVDSDYVGPFYSGLQHLVGTCVNVYSRFDGALSVSNVEKKPREALLAAGELLGKATFGVFDFLERNPDQKWEKRLGSAPHPPNAPPNFTSVNATEIAGRKIDHSDHIDSREVVARIAKELGIGAKS